MSPEKVNRKDRHAVSKENLREVYNEPSQMAKDKVLKKLDKHCQQFITFFHHLNLSKEEKKQYLSILEKKGFDYLINELGFYDSAIEK